MVVNPPFNEKAAIIRTVPTISPTARSATPFAGPDAFRCKTKGCNESLA